MVERTSKYLRGSKEIAHRCGYSVPTLMSWIQERDFPARKKGSIWVAHSDDVDEFMESFVRDEKYVPRKKSKSRKPAGSSSAGGGASESENGSDLDGS